MIGVVRFAVPPSPADKLAIALVVEPDRSRPLPPGQREEATRHLLQTAGDAGIGLVATRPEGDVERMLGQAWPFPSPFRVTVRTVPLADGGVDRLNWQTLYFCRNDGDRWRITGFVGYMKYR